MEVWYQKQIRQLSNRILIPYLKYRTPQIDTISTMKMGPHLKRLRLLKIALSKTPMRISLHRPPYNRKFDFWQNELMNVSLRKFQFSDGVKATQSVKISPKQIWSVTKIPKKWKKVSLKVRIVLLILRWMTIWILKTAWLFNCRLDMADNKQSNVRN